MFAPGSRYERVPEAIHVDASGRELPYKLLRPIPDAPVRELIAVSEGDRLDLLAFRFFDDPEHFWRICDANRALRPDELVETPGRRLVIPLALR